MLLQRATLPVALCSAKRQSAHYACLWMPMRLQVNEMISLSLDATSRAHGELAGFRILCDFNETSWRQLSCAHETRSHAITSARLVTPHSTWGTSLLAALAPNVQEAVPRFDEVVGRRVRLLPLNVA